MQYYNSGYISTFPESAYTKLLGDRNLLIKLADEYCSRHNPQATTHAKDLLLKESLDHYIAKRLDEDSNFINTTEMYNYFCSIAKIYDRDNTEFNTNVVFRNKDLREKIINKYCPKHKALIASNCDSISNRTESIFSKIDHEEQITQDELDFVANYMAKKRDPRLEKAHDVLLKFIFGRMMETNLIFSMSVQDYVVSYLPFFYSGQYERDVRYTFVSNDYGKPIKGPGHSSESNNYIALNREFFKTIDNKSIEDSKVERLQSGKDISFFMIVCFHEMQHQVQRRNSKLAIIDDVGLGTIISYITRKEYGDYLFNHDSYIIEIDANEAGWQRSSCFYSKYYSGKDKEQLISNCFVNGQTSNVRRLFAFKKTSTGEYLPQADYDIESLVKIVRNNPTLVKEYPMLKHYFDENGNVRLSCMCRKMGSNSIEFVNYFLRTAGIDILIKMVDSKTLDNSELNNIINNIYQAIKGKIKAEEDLYYVLKHNSAGEYRNKEEFSEDLVKRLGSEHRKIALMSFQRAIPLFNKIKVMYPEPAEYVDFVTDDLNKRFGIIPTLNDSYDDNLTGGGR